MSPPPVAAWEVGKTLGHPLGFVGESASLPEKLDGPKVQLALDLTEPEPEPEPEPKNHEVSSVIDLDGEMACVPELQSCPR
jgi:hypothetical protein